jgi:CHASE1-domain containing sensor protein
MNNLAFLLSTLRAIQCRAAAAHDHARMSQAYGQEADEHYTCKTGASDQIKRYLSGFAAQWRRSAVDPVRERQRRQITEHARSQGR